MAWIKCVDEKKAGRDEWFNSEKIESIYYSLQDVGDNFTKEIIVKIKPHDFVILKKTLKVNEDDHFRPTKSVIDKDFQKKVEKVIEEVIKKMGRVNKIQMIDFKDKI
jgi:membrane carboxypeptidase/penicillin-binding protein PbpC